MKTIRIEDWGKKRKKPEEIKHYRVPKIEEWETLSRASRGQKAKQLGETAEELAKRILNLKPYKGGISPDLAGIMDGKHVVIEVKHTSRKDVVLWHDQLNKIHNQSKLTTLEGGRLHPYYLIIFSKPEEKVAYLVPTAKLIEEAKKKLKKTAWGLYTYRKEKVKKLNEVSKAQPLDIDKATQAAEVELAKKKLLEKLKRAHFRISERRLKEIAEKIIKL